MFLKHILLLDINVKALHLILGCYKFKNKMIDLKLFYNK